MVVGVTGGIGSGKTAATDMFQQFGIQVVDADVIARAIVAIGSPVLKRITQHFGEHLLTPEGELNRSALRQLIFSDDAAKAQLNAITHPAIRQQLLSELHQASSPYVILSAPLLFENGLDALCQRVLLIDVPEAIQYQRTQARDQVSQQQVAAIINAQMPRQQKIQLATDMIDNSGTLAELQQQVAAHHQRYLQLAETAQ